MNTVKQMMETASTVMQKARTDAQFHALALQDGTKAVEQVLGQPLPDGIKIRFVENNDVSFTLGIPPFRTSDELSDEELEKVAGGREGEDVALGIVEQLPDIAKSVAMGALRR